MWSSSTILYTTTSIVHNHHTDLPSSEHINIHFYSTLLYIQAQTPAMEQWWKIKSQNMDTVLFFKVGKFYEMFHMDADIGMKDIDLIYMKGAKAHSGFPERSYVNK